jgi:hypothetical protein
MCSENILSKIQLFRNIWSVALWLMIKMLTIRPQFCSCKFDWNWLVRSEKQDFKKCSVCIFANFPLIEQEAQGPHHSPESYWLIFRLCTHATLLFFIAIRLNFFLKCFHVNESLSKTAEIFFRKIKIFCGLESNFFSVVTIYTYPKNTKTLNAHLEIIWFQNKKRSKRWLS